MAMCVSARSIHLIGGIGFSVKGLGAIVALSEFDEKAFQKLSEGTVSSIRSGIVYFVHEGRNAWHSTWVRQYSRNCMHTSLEAAKQSCEARRTQGSVFNIEQLPALIIRSDFGQLIVTQINCEVPLAQYSRTAVREEVAAGQRKIEGARNIYLQVGAPIIGAALSFAFSSRFWNAPEDAFFVMVTATDDSKEAFEKLSSGAMLTYRSASVGGSYLLQWRSRENRYQIDAIVRLADESVS